MIAMTSPGKLLIAAMAVADSAIMRHPVSLSLTRRIPQHCGDFQQPRTAQD